MVLQLLAFAQRTEDVKLIHLNEAVEALLPSTAQKRPAVDAANAPAPKRHDTRSATRAAASSTPSSATVEPSGTRKKAVAAKGASGTAKQKRAENE